MPATSSGYDSAKDRFYAAPRAFHRVAGPGRESGRARVLLAYRHTLLRQALRGLLQRDGLEVVAEAENGKDAVEKAERIKPDVVVMDVALPIVNGVEATRLLLRRVPGARVLLLVAGSGDDLGTILRAGAAGCVAKDADSAELSRAIQTVWRGGSYLSPSFPDLAASGWGGDWTEEGEAFPDEPLSPREREVLQLAADGHGNQDIARRLCLSVKTVEAHKAHIMRKLNLRGPAELIKYAIRRGMVDLGVSLAS